MKIYTDKPNVNTIATILQQTFSDEEDIHFVPKEYFDTLTPREKYRYIKTQHDYQVAYRTLLIQGVKTIDIPTTVTEKISVYPYENG
jgi:hypothetical protein